MIISDVAIKRPVFAIVVSLLLVTFGVMSFLRLPLREFPAIDPPIVSIQVSYPGASANIVESKVTKLIESQISGIAGIKTISSVSRDGVAEISVEFTLTRDIDAAAADLRDKVNRIANDLPDGSDPPQISKVEADNNVIVWFNMSSTAMDGLQLTDYAQRFIVDRLSTIDGVAQIRIGGEQRYAMRIWLENTALTAHGLTVSDIEAALRAKNVELPAGRVESNRRDFTVRVDRAFVSPKDFSRMIVKRGANGEFVRLGQVARVEIGPEIARTWFRGNGEPQIGLGIIKQSTANTLQVARAARAEIIKIRKTLPAETFIHFSYDTSMFIEAAINEVYFTLGVALTLVLVVIYLFLGNARAALIPAVTVPVSILAGFIVLDVCGFSVNLLTLLAMVLAIGLVVDDAIVVLENAQRRVDLGEPPLVAAFKGTRQVGFAVIATTLVLIAVFMPLAFVGGSIGRLFTELAIAVAGAVAFSSLIALTLCAMLCSKLLRHSTDKGPVARATTRFFDLLAVRYKKALIWVIDRPFGSIACVALSFVCIAGLVRVLPSELAPQEDRGAFFVIVNGPEGTGFEETARQMMHVEAAMMKLIVDKEAIRALVRAPRGFGPTEEMHTGMGIVVMAPWGERKGTTWQAISKIRKDLWNISAVRAFSVMRQGFGQRGPSKPVQLVIQGTSYEELARWRDIILSEARKNPGLIGIDADYKETRPQLRVTVLPDRAAELGVSLAEIGRTLETMFGMRRVTTYIDRGEEYDIILQSSRQSRMSGADLMNVHVRSERTEQLIPLSNLVQIEERAGAGALGRFDRLRAVTIEANLAPGYTLGEALGFLEKLIRDHTPDIAGVGYKGESADFQEASTSMYFVIGLALLVVFLVLAAQFESFIHPVIVMVTVPLALAGALLGLLVFGSSISIYSQIGMVILIGLAAKNGILIVEFANQLRDQGWAFGDALIEASVVRLRPILMTGVSTIAGAMPLVLATGAGSESRFTIGIVIVTGLTSATVVTLFVVPVFYNLMARRTGSPGAIARQLAAMEDSSKAAE